MTDEKPAPVRVAAEPDSRLAQLIAERATLAPAVKAAKARLEELNDAIKVELTQARPASVDTVVTAGAATPLRMYAKTSRRLNQKRLKETVGPDVYDTLCDDSVSWTLVEVQ